MFERSIKVVGDAIRVRPIDEVKPQDAASDRLHAIELGSDRMHEPLFGRRLAEIACTCQIRLLSRVARGLLHRDADPVRERRQAAFFERVLEQHAKGFFREESRIEEQRMLCAIGSRGDVEPIDLEIRQQIEEVRRVELQNVIEQEFGDRIGRSRRGARQATRVLERAQSSPGSANVGIPGRGRVA